MFCAILGARPVLPVINAAFFANVPCVTPRSMCSGFVDIGALSGRSTPLPAPRVLLGAPRYSHGESCAVWFLLKPWRWHAHGLPQYTESLSTIGLHKLVVLSCVCCKKVEHAYACHACVRMRRVLPSTLLPSDALLGSLYLVDRVCPFLSGFAVAQQQARVPPGVGALAV